MNHQILSCLFRIYTASTPPELLSAICNTCVALKIPADWTHAADWKLHLEEHVLPQIEKRHPEAATLITISMDQVKFAAQPW